MLGHFRHEIGHYYWTDPGRRAARDEAFRALFGDERADYGGARAPLRETARPRTGRETHVSAYATMHPWEDWAETFAHYLHIRDVLQTARRVGTAATARPDPGSAARPTLVDDWLPLSYALNAINRSLGHGDLYPYVLTAGGAGEARVRPGARSLARR